MNDVPPKSFLPSVKKTLKAKQRKKQRLAAKLAATQAKLAKRMLKLRSIESEIARLQQLTKANRSSGALDRSGAPSQSSATLIYNPKCGVAAKGRASLEEVVQILHRHGIRPDVRIKSCGKDARKFAQAAVASGDKLVIVAGGDGTVEDVAAQLIGTKTVLGILPIGTMNNLARSVGIPLELEAACALLAVGSARRIDVGHIKIGEKAAKKYFLETAGIGVTAVAFPAGQAAKKGQLNVLPRAFRKLFDHKPGPVQITLDGGESMLANAQLVTVSNAPLMGLNFLIAPAAKMDDGLLDIAIYEGMGKTNLLEFFMATRNGQRVDNPDVKHYQASQVRVQSQTEQPVHSDKDVLPPQRVLNVEIVPQALSMVVGNGIGLNAPADALQLLQPLPGPLPPPTAASTDFAPANDVRSDDGSHAEDLQ